MSIDNSRENSSTTFPSLSTPVLSLVFVINSSMSVFMSFLSVAKSVVCTLVVYSSVSLQISDPITPLCAEILVWPNPYRLFYEKSIARQLSRDSDLS